MSPLTQLLSQLTPAPILNYLALSVSSCEKAEVGGLIPSWPPNFSSSYKPADQEFGMKRNGTALRCAATDSSASEDGCSRLVTTGIAGVKNRRQPANKTRGDPVTSTDRVEQILRSPQISAVLVSDFRSVAGNYSPRLNPQIVRLHSLSFHS